MEATVRLLKSDSSFVTGVTSNSKGVFHFSAPRDGDYILKLSSIGYKPHTQSIKINNKQNVSLGKISLFPDAVMLNETTVSANAIKVAVKGDTLVYNSAAYKVPEGSVIEELVKRLPGAKVDENGKITINGKEVKKIYIDGKEFMTGDTQTALKNLPTSIVEKVKSYNEKSDMTRITGIDDGEEEAVLDFGLKPGMNKGFFSNLNAACGTKDRYAARVMGAYFKNNLRIMGFGNANNTNDMGFGGRGGRFGRRNNGLSTAKMSAFDINYEEKDKLIINGTVAWNHRNGDVYTKSNSENFVSRVASFSNSQNQSYTRGNSWFTQFRIEWKPDTMTNILFRPRMNYSTNDRRNWGNSASYNEDPFSYAEDPLSEESIALLAKKGLMVNSRNNSSVGFGKGISFNGMLQFNRKFGNRGRNLTFRIDGGYNDDENKNLSLNNVHLYLIQDVLGNDSAYQTNRYNLTPATSWNYRLRVSYSEPISRGAFLQFDYNYRYGYNKSDRSTYDFSNLGENFFSGLNPEYRHWDAYLNRLSQPYGNYLDKDLSRFAEYRNYTHQARALFRKVTEKYNFSAGAMIEPQKTSFIQEYQGINIDTVRHVINFSPELDMRYRFSKDQRLEVRYRGRTSQPSLTNLMNITDDSDPLNIVRGNPGLKPAFTHSFSSFYSNFIQSHQQFFMVRLNYSNTLNSISSKVSYNDKTGGRVTQPENINGNWNVSTNLVYNTSVDTAGVWNVNTATDLNYNNYVSYLTLGRNAQAEINKTRSLNINERLAASYRYDWMEVELDGMLNYLHSKNKLQNYNNLDTWRFSYGANITMTAPWGTSLSTDIHENSRRGFNDQSMNTNELIWNVQLSQSFLRQNNLTVMLQFYDILRQESNFSRTVNATLRSDTEYNAINSYAMLHVIYRFQLFGGKSSFNHGPGDRGRKPRFHGRPHGSFRAPRIF